MTYRSIHTTYGLQQLVLAEASGTPLEITHVVFGDGAGSEHEPDPAQTELVREVYRTTVNRVFADPADAAGILTVEAVIAGAQGGWVLREVGLLDASGQLLCVGSLPPTYKPEPGVDAATADLVLRLKLYFANTEAVSLVLDPNVVIASHAWVLSVLTASRVLPGGTTGQVLRKHTNADGDVEWADPTAVNVLVSSVEEQQQLVDGQTVVNLAVCTTVGLALYVNGARLASDAWTPHPSIATRLTLLTPNVGVKALTAVQNEPAGHIPLALERDKNLSDLADKAAARSALSVYSKTEVNNKNPPGRRVEFYRSTAPTGFLKCNGAAVSRTTYAALFAVIGTSFGAGDGATTFNLPDDRGLFARGWDDGRGVDPGRTFGSEQAAALASHTHTASTAGAGKHAHSASTASAGSHGHAATSGAEGGHDHGANTGAVGGHTHGFKDRYQAGTNYELLAHYAAMPAGHNGNLGTNSHDYNNTAFAVIDTTTDSAGGHSHSLSAELDHSHAISVQTGGAHTHTVTVDSVDAHTHTVTVNAAGGTETRPRNRSVLVCISY